MIPDLHDILRTKVTKSATTSSTGGLVLALKRAFLLLAQKGGIQALLPVRYKTVLLESSFLDSSACSFIYFCTASSVILPIVST